MHLFNVVFLLMTLNKYFRINDTNKIPSNYILVCNVEMKTKSVKQIGVSCFYLNIEYRDIPSPSVKAELFVKTILETLILMTQVSLYLFFLLDESKTAKYVCNSKVGYKGHN